MRCISVRSHVCCRRRGELERPLQSGPADHCSLRHSDDLLLGYFVGVPSDMLGIRDTVSAQPVRESGRGERSRPNFTRLVLGCIEETIASEYAFEICRKNVLLEQCKGVHCVDSARAFKRILTI